MANNPQALRLAQVSQEQAARAFSACAGRDPAGVATPDSMAYAGRCFRLEGTTGGVVFSVGAVGSSLWCYAAAGHGSGMTAAGLRTLEHLARNTGCASVSFQTMRRGMVRQATRNGYQIKRPIGAGYILEKSIS